MLSAFTLNALGMSGAKVEAVVEYELEILDSDDHRINSYIGQGFAKRWIEFYYGNGAPERTVHTEAV